jgi:hypothetical protein
MCAQIDNQRSHGAVIARVHSFCSKPSSSMLRSLPIDVPLPLRRLGSNLSSTCLKQQDHPSGLVCCDLYT